MKKKSRAPIVYIIAGPNGAGKTTFAREFLPKYAKCKNFVNADLIAQGVSPFAPEAAAIRAGRMMLSEIRRLIQRRVDFGFETTLSGRTYLQLVQFLKSVGYRIHIYFVWLPTVGLAKSRVQMRVERGGHSISPGVLKRRYPRSIQNFLKEYQPLADRWILFDNSGPKIRVIAEMDCGSVRVIDESTYNELMSRYEKEI